MKTTILRFDTVDSTNTEAANQARRGADEGLCVIARQQTAGRGRHGRTWVSPPDTGLYFSILLRPKIEPRFLPLITIMTGIAVYDTLKEIGLGPDIKWVNDILIGDKKISGILAETVETPTGNAVIVGIGINFTNRNFPDDVAETATSIMSERGAVTTGPSDIEERLIAFLTYWYDTLNADGGANRIIQNWRTRSTYFSDKDVRVTLPDKTIEGVTDGLEENGALRVKLADGSISVVQAGDVERLR